MGNTVSAVHQAAMEGDVSKLRVAVQEQPQRINESEPTQVCLAAVAGNCSTCG